MSRHVLVMFRYERLGVFLFVPAVGLFVCLFVQLAGWVTGWLAGSLYACIVSGFFDF